MTADELKCKEGKRYDASGGSSIGLGPAERLLPMSLLDELKETNYVPSSLFALEKPLLWRQSLQIATRLTGKRYVNKLPSEDGTIWMCGSGGGGSFYSDECDDDEWRKGGYEKKKDGGTENGEDTEDSGKEGVDELQDRIDRLERLDKDRKRRIEIDREIEILRKEKDRLHLAQIVHVPEGAVEWLAHEVGHWLSSDHRDAFNMGMTEYAENDSDVARQEWEAMAFEDILFAPWAPSRILMPPSYRGGIPFSKDTISPVYFSAMEKKMRSARIDIEEWRQVFGPYAEWELSRRDRNELI